MDKDEIKVLGLDLRKKLWRRFINNAFGLKFENTSQNHGM